MSFSDEQLLRYSRHIMVNEFDIAGQKALANASILIVGVGGLGCPVALYLAAAGIAHIYLMDDDKVALSNLQRQILFSQNDIDTPKVNAAKQKLLASNSGTFVTVLKEKFTNESLTDLVGCIELVIDCTDNSLARRAINQACFKHQLPLVSGAATGWRGQLTTFDFRTGSGPCYQCLFPRFDDDTSCSNNGIISPVVGIIGVSQALEAIKLVSDCGHINHGQLCCFNGFTGDWRKFNYQQDAHCNVCSYAE